MNIHWLGIAYKGAPIQIDGYTLYPNNLSGGDIYGAYSARNLAESINADFVLLLNDVWMLHNYSRTLTGHSWKNLAYIPLDGKITQPELLHPLSFLDDIILYTNCAKNQFEIAFNSPHMPESHSSIPNLHTIYHGLDRRLTSGEELADTPTRAKQELFGHLHDWQQTIFLLNANRHSERKDLKTCLKGFAMAKSKSNGKIVLCLHLPATHPMKMEELNSWIRSLNIESSVIINPIGDSYVSNEKLAQLYSACEIGINTSLGEGWGLISFEHAACGGAQIVPGSENQKEIWQSAPLYTDLEEEIFLPTNPFLMHKSSTESLANNILALTEDRDKLNSYRQSCFDRAKSPLFDWDNLADQWTTLFNSL